MRRRIRRTGSPGNAAIAAVTVCALCAGAVLLRDGRGDAPPQPSAAQAHSELDAHGPARSAAPALPPSPPDRVRIPAIGVDAPLTGLGLTPAGSWTCRPTVRTWPLVRGGHHPGERGTAIVAGHVDNADGPAVFYSLGALRKGSTIETDRRDGTVAVFTVDAVEAYDARDFPDEKVYGAASRPELRVITCGGGYSPRRATRATWWCTPT
ncbi:sortase domain-bontaining protein [Streptomyces thermocarboxydus]